jgi:NADH-quinone oxidoreductase subunit K
VFVIAAAEASVGLAIIISIYRNKRSVVVEDVNLLKG